MNNEDLIISEIDPDIFNAERNALTEYSGNYIRISESILACYDGIPNSAVSKVASLLFRRAVMKDKLYGYKDIQGRDINETKRIYNYQEVTIEDLLREGYSIKYSEKDTMATDRGNILKRIRILEENNVFHVWQCQDTQMYIMERDVGSWKFYNTLGCITPKFLKKIVGVSEDMILTMINMIERKYGSFNRNKINKSFGKFINNIIGRMNPILLTKISLWDNQQDIHEYLKILSSQLKPIDNNEGLEFDDKFIKRLPFSVANKMKDRIRKRINRSKNTMKKRKPVIVSEQEQMMNDLIPKNPIVNKKTRIRREHVVKVSDQQSTPLMPETHGFKEDPQPFKDPRQFVEYYRSCITLFAGKRVKFEPYEIDCPNAALIMDTLIGKGKDNKDFLTTWFRGYYDNYLKGYKILKTKYTSLKAVRETLVYFEEKSLHE